MTTSRYRIEHRSVYRYANVVPSSFNEVRLTPMTTPHQLVLDARVEVEPGAPLQRYVDYWGSVVHAFDLHKPHGQLTIAGYSVVEAGPPPPPAADVGWEALDDARLRDRYLELLTPTVQVPADPRLAGPAGDLRRSCALKAAGAAAVAWVHEQLRYVPGTTGVHTSAVEAWEGGEGVCQDFAHLALALLRTVGMPARYCSGYVHPDRDPAVGATVAGQSHAWVEVWDGEWRQFDPSAGAPIDERYVLVAKGRDYADVPPLKGIFHGGPTSRLDVTVQLTRLM